MGERKCQVWQLAVGGESNPPPHLHMPCLPGGGMPGGGLTMRTYEGGCRSACSGSVRHPVQHLYPAGRIKKWLFDTKEWFWDGIFVMKTKNPQKSASHYCLPFPRPTMRLPRSCDRRLVEVHHVHPPPSMVGSGEGVPVDELGDGTLPQNAVKISSQEGSEPQTEVGSDLFPIDSQRPGPTESPVSGDGQESGKPPVLNQPQKTDHAEKKRTMPGDGGKVGRISHISVVAGSPAPAKPGELQFQGRKYRDPTDHQGSELTYIDYRASSCCPRFCRRKCCHGTGCFPCIPAQWKFLVRRGVVCCFIRTASACLCLSSTCAALSFCFRNVARNVDSVATTAVDVKELINCYIFVADMPGLNHSEIKVQVENDSVLKLSGDRHEFSMETEIKYVQLERNPGRLMRKFNLPADSNLDGISAACEDGLLTVIVPKIPLPDPYRPRSFDVDVHSIS